MGAIDPGGFSFFKAVRNVQPTILIGTSGQRGALTDAGAPLYPLLESVREISRKVAVAVGVEAQRAGLAKTTSLDELERNVRDKMWIPHYVQLRRTAH